MRRRSNWQGIIISLYLHIEHNRHMAKTCQYDGGQRALAAPAGSTDGKSTQPFTAIPVPTHQTAQLWLLDSRRPFCAYSGGQYICHQLYPTVHRGEKSLDTTGYNYSTYKGYTPSRDY